MTKTCKTTRKRRLPVYTLRRLLTTETDPVGNRSLTTHTVILSSRRNGLQPSWTSVLDIRFQGDSLILLRWKTLRNGLWQGTKPKKEKRQDEGVREGSERTFVKNLFGAHVLMSWIPYEDLLSRILSGSPLIISLQEDLFLKLLFQLLHWKILFLYTGW